MFKTLKSYVLAGFIAVMGLTASLAHAELPAAVGTTFTEITANINAIFALAFPVVALGLGLMVVIKLFKRFGNKV